MAERGKPLPFKTREEIKQAREYHSIRQTAKVLEVSRNTVRKYGKFDPPPSPSR